MADINKIIGVAATAITKVSGVAISAIAKVIDQVVAAAGLSTITDVNAVAKSITTGTTQAVYITDSNGHYNYDHNDPFTVSFWIKVGWDVSVNTDVYLFSSSDVNAPSANKDTFRIWYYEPHNRIYVEWRDTNGYKKQNFWLFHSTSSPYGTAYTAAGLGSTYWNSSNRGNANSDGYTLITVTRGTTNSAASSNLKLYWNDASCGAGFYASGGGSGTPNMGNTTDKQIALASDTWNFNSSGNNTETKFNGVSIWDKVLTAAEVTELYNAGVPGDLTSHTAATNLKGFWNFETNGSNEIAGGPAFTINGNSNVENK